MRGHIAAENTIDLLDGRGSHEEHEHLRSCPACAERLEELRSQLGALETVEVPEPSPMYWEAFRRQVGRKLEAQPRRCSWGWLWAPALAASAAAALFLSLRSAPGAPSSVSPSASVPAWSALPADDADGGLGVLRALAEGGQLGASAVCDELAACVEALSDEDAAALAETLRGALAEGREL